MALAHAFFRLNVELAETSGKTTRKAYRLVAADAAAAATASGTILTRLQAVTDLKVKSYQIEDVFTDATFSLPIVAVQKENQAIITVGIDGQPTKSGTIVIPGPKAGVFVSTIGGGVDIVDTSAAIVTDYVAIFDTDNLALLSDGEVADVTTFFAGRRRHVKNRVS